MTPGVPTCLCVIPVWRLNVETGVDVVGCLVGGVVELVHPVTATRPQHVVHHVKTCAWNGIIVHHDNLLNNALCIYVNHICLMLAVNNNKAQIPIKLNIFLHNYKF